MKRFGRTALVIAGLCAQACAADRGTGSPAGADPTALVPPLTSLPGWTIAEATTEYSPDTLFEYLDGAAPRYLAFGFRRLAHVRFAVGGDGIALDVYDMGSKLGAFGIYSSGRPPDIVARDWGAEGYRYGEAAAAWKDRIYVHALADRETPALASHLERLVALVVAAAPGEASPPEILSRLPVEGLVRHSSRYVAKDLFGHSFLPGGILARYDCGSGECLLFLCDAGSPGAARQAIGKLLDHERRHGAVLEGEPSVGEGGFRAEDPGLGAGVVTRLGRLVAGVWGGDSSQQRDDLLAALAARFGDSVPRVSVPATETPVAGTETHRNR